MDSLEFARSIVDVLEEKKGEDILLLDIQGITTIADYFIICSGSSNRMLDALAEAVTRYVREKYRMRTKIEGIAQNGWLLADYGDVVVHIFSEEQRSYYNLEELWSQGKTLLRLQ